MFQAMKTVKQFHFVVNLANAHTHRLTHYYFVKWFLKELLAFFFCSLSNVFSDTIFRVVGFFFGACVESVL